MKSKKIKTKLKMLRAIFFIFFFLIFLSIIIGLSQAGKIKNKGTRDNENKGAFSIIIPQDLTILDEDYRDRVFDDTKNIVRSDIQEATLSTTSVSSLKSDVQNSIGDSRNDGISDTLETKKLDDAVNEYAQSPSIFNGQSYANSFEGKNQYNSSTGYTNRLAVLRDYLSNNFSTADTVSMDSSLPSYVQKGRKSALFVSQAGTNDAASSLLDGASQLTNILGSGVQGVALAENTSNYDMQNSQKRKQEFLDEKQTSQVNLGSKSQYVQLQTDYVIAAGSVIPIVLLTKINSDLPGNINARVVENIYDTFSGYNLLIPKGSLLIGSYDSEISWGQLRTLVVWERLTRPDGVSVALQGMQGVDAQGSAGLVSRVKTTIAESMSVTILSSLFKLGVEYASSYAHNSTNSKTIADSTNSTGRAIVSTATELANKLLDRQPTLTVDPGTESLVFVHYDIELPVLK